MMAKYICYVLAFFVYIVLSGCAGGDGQPGNINHTAKAKIDVTNQKLVKNVLLDYYRDWQGVPYREGGLNRNGIDCSGFVYLAYRSQFGIQLPRTTSSLAKSGRIVYRTDLKAGDLVLFKTGWFDRHIGIYLDDMQFIHVSSRRGVTLSRIDGYYWKGRFLQARRIFY
jgi:cell wall-associated NlpC family hydrolase